MGRSYEGDINGKFWFGVQDTACIEKYGGTATGLSCWNGCGCLVEEGDNDGDFCECHDSAEAHEELAGEAPMIEHSRVILQITKQQFEQVAVPWMLANEDVKKYIKKWTFSTE